MKYNRELKKKLCKDICINHASTLKTANEYNIPIKTLEKLITAFNRDNHCFLQKEYKVILELSNKYSINMLCKEMKINRSGYYKWLYRCSNPSQREIKRKSSCVIFDEYHTKFPSHGYRCLMLK